MGLTEVISLSAVRASSQWQQLRDDLHSRARSQGSRPWQTQIIALDVSRPSIIFFWRWAHISGIACSAVCPSYLRPGDIMELRPEPAHPIWPFPFTPQD